MRVFIDLDGVVADFVGGAMRRFHKPSPYGGPHVGERAWDICKLWDLDPTDFWSALDFDFWAGLEPTREAEAFLQILRREFGFWNLCFLTQPRPEHGCLEGKRHWCRIHYPDIPVLLASYADQHHINPKHFVAHPGALLIDDCTANVVRFRECGGAAFLVPRPWNAQYADEPQAAELLSRFLDGLFADRARAVPREALSCV